MRKATRRAFSVFTTAVALVGMQFASASSAQASHGCAHVGSVGTNPPTVCLYTGYLGTEQNRSITLEYATGGGAAGLTLSACYTGTSTSGTSGCTYVGYLGVVDASGDAQWTRQFVTFGERNETGTAESVFYVFIDHDLSQGRIWGRVGEYSSATSQPFDVVYNPCTIC